MPFPFKVSLLACRPKHRKEVGTKPFMQSSLACAVHPVYSCTVVFIEQEIDCHICHMSISWFLWLSFYFFKNYMLHNCRVQTIHFCMVYFLRLLNPLFWCPGPPHRVDVSMALLDPFSADWGNFEKSQKHSLMSFTKLDSTNEEFWANILISWSYCNFVS